MLSFFPACDGGKFRWLAPFPALLQAWLGRCPEMVSKTGDLLFEIPECHLNLLPDGICFYDGYGKLPGPGRRRPKRRFSTALERKKCRKDSYFLGLIERARRNDVTPRLSVRRIRERTAVANQWNV